MTMSATWYRSSVFLLVLIAVPGFAPGAQAGDDVAGVTGQITLDGNPLSGGRIIFHQDDGQFIGAKIDKSGKFKVDRVLVGKHKVTVESKGVPAKYASDEVSALQIEVKNGKNVFDFSLTSK
jgi:hypothetical protein